MNCAHAVKVRATDVSAIVHNGFLLGQSELEASDPRRKLVPQQYDVLEFCRKPTCEKVFKAERKEEDA